MYLTNLPILAATFSSPDDTEIAISLDTYVMSMRVIKRTSQHYIIEQHPGKHVKVTSKFCFYNYTIGMK